MFECNVDKKIFYVITSIVRYRVMLHNTQIFHKANAIMSSSPWISSCYINIYNNWVSIYMLRAHRRPSSIYIFLKSTIEFVGPTSGF